MFEPKRLHPVSIFSDLLAALKEMVVPFILIILLGGNNSYWVQVLLMGGSALLWVVLAFLSWLRFTYWVEDGELRIESGVFIKKKRYIRFERIHSIDVSEGVLQRLFGLVKVNIETAGSSGSQADAVLTAIQKQKANQLISILYEVKRNKGLQELGTGLDNDLQTKYQQPAFTFKQTFPQLFLMAATSGGVGVVFSGAVALLLQFDELIPIDKLSSGFEQFMETGVVFVSLIVLIILLLAYAIATVRIVLLYAFFTVKKVDDELIFTRGLLERRQLTIPLKKIQGIRIAENLIRQPLGYASVYVEYAGGSAADKETFNVMLFPLIKRNKLNELIKQFAPGYECQNDMTALPKRAVSRYIYRNILFVFPVVVGLIWFVRPWGYFSLLLPVLACFWAYLQHKAAGWDIVGDQLQLRSRFVSKQTFIFQKTKIQSIESRRSWFQNKKQLITISATVKSGIGPRRARIVDLEKEDAMKIKEWFSYER
jgi:putative membrane protein